MSFAKLVAVISRQSCNVQESVRYSHTSCSRFCRLKEYCYFFTCTPSDLTLLDCDVVSGPSLPCLCMVRNTCCRLAGSLPECRNAIGIHGPGCSSEISQRIFGVRLQTLKFERWPKNWVWLGRQTQRSAAECQRLNCLYRAHAVCFLAADRTALNKARWWAALGR